MFRYSNEGVVIPKKSFVAAVLLNFETPVPDVHLYNQAVVRQALSKVHRRGYGRRAQCLVAVPHFPQVDAGDRLPCRMFPT